MKKAARLTTGQKIWREKKRPKIVTEDQKIEIRGLFASGTTMTAIAKRYDLAVSTISRVINPEYQRRY